MISSITLSRARPPQRCCCLHRCPQKQSEVVNEGVPWMVICAGLDRRGTMKWWHPQHWQAAKSSPICGVGGIGCGCWQLVASKLPVLRPASESAYLGACWFHAPFFHRDVRNASMRSEGLMLSYNIICSRPFSSVYVADGS